MGRFSASHKANYCLAILSLQRPHSVAKDNEEFPFLHVSSLYGQKNGQVEKNALDFSRKSTHNIHDFRTNRRTILNKSKTFVLLYHVSINHLYILHFNHTKYLFRLVTGDITCTLNSFRTIKRKWVADFIGRIVTCVNTIYSGLA